MLIILIIICTGCSNNSDKNSTITGSSAELPKDSTINETTATQKETETTITQESSTITQIEKVVLDKTYKNKKFEFEFEYPGIWIFAEEPYHEDLPDQGAIIYVGISDSSLVDKKDIRKNDYIRIFGQISKISFSDPGFKSGEFVTDSGINPTFGKMSKKTTKIATF